jgi:class 3 adenylate cyclase
MDAPETKYARSGDVRVAYQVSGEGPLDVVLLPTWFTQVDAFWEIPQVAELLHRVESFGRLIQFDKRGVGLSDPIPLQSLPTLEEWMDDLRAVLDAVGSERAALVASLHAGPMAMLFASTYPERTSALVLVEAFARGTRAHDYPFAMPERLVDAAVQFVLDNWGTGVALDLAAPDKAGDAQMRSWYARYERNSVSPSAAAVMSRMLLGVDVRGVLPSIRVPTLIVHRKDGRFVRVDHGRFLAEHISGARYLEVPGSDQLWWSADDRFELMDEVEEFLTGVRPTHEPDRVLATILFTDIVGSTEQAAERGDRSWRELLGRHRQLVRRQLERYRGREVATTGDGFLATFDGPARAVRCAAALVDTSRPLGIEIRTGLHTGEIELMGDDVGGIAVHIGARISALAGSGEVLVSSTVKDLIAGSGIEFDDRGSHELKGVPGEWRLFAVTP